MIHDLFQNVLVLDLNTRNYSTTEELSQVGGVDVMSLLEIVEDILFRHAHSLFVENISSGHMQKVLLKIVLQLMKWYKSFLGSGNLHTRKGVVERGGGEGA